MTTKKTKTNLFIFIVLLITLLSSCDIIASSDFPYQSSVNLAIIFQFIIILLTDILLGGGCLIAGIYLLFKGISGNAIVVLEINNLKATILNCTPGMFLIIAGVIIIYLNKFDVKLGTAKKKTNNLARIILIILVIILILLALSFCIYGGFKANSSNIEWMHKI